MVSARRYRLFLFAFVCCWAVPALAQSPAALVRQGNSLYESQEYTEAIDRYEEALVDGCNEEQAYMVAMGVKITDAELEIPPLGWYRAKREYMEYFCRDHEMTETDEREQIAST